MLPPPVFDRAAALITLKGMPVCEWKILLDVDTEVKTNFRQQ
jgi:hypothetical protein